MVDPNGADPTLTGLENKRVIYNHEARQNQNYVTNTFATERARDPEKNTNSTMADHHKNLKRSREELEASNNGRSSQNKITGSLDEEVKNPSLNLALATTPEYIKQIESPQQQQEQRQRHDSNTTPSRKTKALHFPISKITIGEWTREAVYGHDLKAKIYFGRKKIMWECLQDEVTRKIEMQWCDVLSLRTLCHRHDNTGIILVELRKPPTFWIETNVQAGKPTQWQQLDQDFTLNHSASRNRFFCFFFDFLMKVIPKSHMTCYNRIHELDFAPGVMQENMTKLLSSDSYWSELFKVHFPTSEHLYFDDEKQNPMSFPISKITIGEWTCDAVNEQDLQAKIYFERRQIMWEGLEDVTTTETTRKMHWKIEMQWCDVLSLTPSYHAQTGILKVELRVPPTFFIKRETSPRSGRTTQWQQLDQDFTLNHSASRNRIHTLYFAPGVLQENMKKLVSGDRFWSELVKVHFPTLEHRYFDDIGYGNSKNNVTATQFHGNHESSNND
ncbi:unnamed protein product [Eruca vesicaria subsp. sativa]|uniref:TRF2/HOY1 PH-like domain-containing protein n=1 Tax=Eruca vesicaria subsp. sativa TaxID=29727 RepID=A0ABC8IYU9_ERUVS|nr:unnamed protein product [Eruca vesicaria subsp. sativa]